MAACSPLPVRRSGIDPILSVRVDTLSLAETTLNHTTMLVLATMSIAGRDRCFSPTSVILLPSANELTDILETEDTHVW